METGNLDRFELPCFALMEHAGDGILLIDRNGRVVDVNRRMVDLVQGQKRNLIGREARHFFPENEHARLGPLLGGFAAGCQVSGEFTLLRENGDALPVEVSGTAIGEGCQLYCIGSFRDLTASKQAEAALRESEARHRAIFEHAGIGIEVCDADGRITEVNRSLQRMLGFGPDELLGRHWSELIHEGDPTVDLHCRALPEHPIVVRQRFRRKDDSLLWAEVTLTTIKDPRGDLRYIVALITDITRQRMADALQRRQKAELERARKAAEEGSAAKTRFLATASHDLRQPIQAIHLLVHLLAQSNLSKDTGNLVEKLRCAVDGLGEMLDSLLDISKLDAGLVTADISDFDLGVLLHQLADEFRPLAEQRGITLKLAPTAIWVRSDRSLLMRVLTNLLSNAVRYTDAGTVLVGVRRHGNSVWIQVHDTGSGIPEEELYRIFEEFHQLGNKARDRREGLGLGLAIVERLTTLLGHDVKVDSQVGRGTVFGVNVPRAAKGRNRDKEQLKLPIGFLESRIVVVDDDIDIREGLRLVLTGWGYRVTAVEDLSQAIEACRVSDPPALVIADYRLEGANGMEVIRAIRKECRRVLPALLLTGDASPEREQEAAKEGLRLLRKPTTPNELRAAVTDALELARSKRRRRNSQAVW